MHYGICLKAKYLHFVNTTICEKAQAANIFSRLFMVPVQHSLVKTWGLVNIALIKT